MAKRKKSASLPARRPVAASGGAAVRLRLRFPSTKAAIGEAVRRVMKDAQEMRCGRSERADLEIALREALANAVLHGNAGDPSKKVTIRCSFSRRRGMVLAVRDEGRGFDPGRIPDPRESDRLFLQHGRGLFLMRKLMDRVEYRDGGREIILYKEPCRRPTRPLKRAAPKPRSRSRSS